jgi:hypothetical protein
MSQRKQNGELGELFYIKGYVGKKNEKTVALSTDRDDRGSDLHIRVFGLIAGKPFEKGFIG